MVVAQIEKFTAHIENEDQIRCLKFYMHYSFNFVRYVRVTKELHPWHHHDGSVTRVQLTDKIENVDQIWCRLQKKTNIKINHFKTDNGAFLKLPNISTFFGQVFFFCGAAQRLRRGSTKRSYHKGRSFASS